MRRTTRASQAAAFGLFLLLALPLSALTPGAAAPEPTALQPMSHPDYPTGSWRMFHANPEHTGVGSTTVPPRGHVVWTYANNTFDVPEGGAAVEGDLVYAGMGAVLTAVNLSTGNFTWGYRATGRILTTPAIWNNTVYFGSEGSFGNDNFYAVNATTGLKVWNVSESPADLGGGIHWVHSSPTVTGGRVFYGSFTYWFYARNAENGSLTWSANLSSEIIAAPAESGGIVYVATRGVHNPVMNQWDVQPTLFAFYANNGTQVWNQSVIEGHLIASPVVSGGVVYQATAGFSYAIADVDAGYILAFHALTGAPLWRSLDVGRMTATPAVSGNTMFVATAGQQAAGLTSTNARLRALDLAANASEIWSSAVGANAAMDSSPAFAAPYVIAAARDGTVAVFLASDGSIKLWSYALPEEVTAPVAVAAEMIFVPCIDGALYAFGARPDFAVTAADIRLSDLTTHVGEPVGINVTVRNVGDKLGSAVLQVGFRVNGTVVPAFSRQVANLTYGLPGVATFEEPWVFNAPGNIEVVANITDVTPVDGVLENNSASTNLTILPELSGWAGRFADGSNSNFRESATPQNEIPKFYTPFPPAGSGFAAFDTTLAAAHGLNVSALVASNLSLTHWVRQLAAPVVGTPALAAGVLVVVTADSIVWFIDPDDGAVLGSASLPAPATTSPVPSGNQALIGATDRLVLVSVATRAVVRVLPVATVPPAFEPAFRSEPAVAGDFAFAVSSVGELHAYNLSSGSEAAGFPAVIGVAPTYPPVVGGGFVFVSTGPWKLAAFSLSPLLPLPVWEKDFGEPVGPSLAFAYDHLFVAHGASNVTALSAASGARYWNATLPAPQVGAAVLAVGNDTVFVGAQSIYAFSANDGTRLWSYDFSTRGAILGPAALHVGALYVQLSGGSVAAFGLVPGVPPIANIASPFNGGTYRVGDVVRFSAAGSFDPEGQAVTYTWDFGDGNFSNLGTVDHIYTFANTRFDVRLTVTDVQGLEAAKTVFIRVVDNTPPALQVGVDQLYPPASGPPLDRLDTTTWTLTVRYSDPDGDAPTFVRINISNESDGVHDMVAQDSGPHDYTQPVAFIWSGQLASGKHNYSFSASDGLANTSTPPSGNFNVYRLEVGNITPFTFVALYLGQGNISYSPRPQLLGPPGLGAIDRFELKVPQNATLLQFINISFHYRLTTNLTEFNETSIAFWWLDQSTQQWTRVEASGLDTDQKLVWINHTKDGIFGVFGNRTVSTRPPTAIIHTTDGRNVYEPNEVIQFSAAESFDPNNATLTYLWDFGDGNTSTERVANHSYAEPGNYVVRLTVTNSYNLDDNESVTITVRTSASANFFLGIAIAIVAALFVLFVLWPVWSRRGKRGGAAQPPGPQPPQPSGREGEAPFARKGAAKRASVRGNGAPLTDDEAKVVDELDREFENQVKGQPPP